MALFNEILVGRFNRGLQKMLGIKGQVPAPQITAEIGPTIDVESFMVPEHRYLQGWELFSFALSAPGVAAQNGAVRIRNPVGSNMVAVFELIRGNQVPVANAADFYRLTQNGPNFTTDLTTGVPMVTNRLDPRGRTQSALIASQQNNFTITTGIIVGVCNLPVATQADFILTHDQEYPLLPGEALTVVSSVVNQQMSVQFKWRERFLEDPERT